MPEIPDALIQHYGLTPVEVFRAAYARYRAMTRPGGITLHSASERHAQDALPYLLGPQYSPRLRLRSDGATWLACEAPSHVSDEQHAAALADEGCSLADPPDTPLEEWHAKVEAFIAEWEAQQHDD
jgi:hypothetical protein